MSLIGKITSKFQNLLRFEKLNPLNNYNFEESLENNHKSNNIELLKKAFDNHPELKEVIWIGIYHCINTVEFDNECLTVLDKNSDLIVDLLEGTDWKVNVPEIVKKEYKKGNILATFHNHFGGAILPSLNDFNNSVLPNISFSVITSADIIGIIINDNNAVDSIVFQQLINDFKLFEIYLNFCFSNDEYENVKILENTFKGQDFIEQRKFLFDKYIAKNRVRFISEFNSRMEKFNVYYVYINL